MSDFSNDARGDWGGAMANGLIPMTQPNHKGGNMIFDGNNTNEPTVYAVGLLRDWKMYRNGNRSLKTTLYWFSKSWARRSYYNGYLAETEDKHRCGRGWTRKAALRSWAKIPRGANK